MAHPAMMTQVIEGVDAAGEVCCAFYMPGTDLVFGPRMPGTRARALAFARSLGTDPANLDEDRLRARYRDWSGHRARLAARPIRR